VHRAAVNVMQIIQDQEKNVIKYRLSKLKKPVNIMCFLNRYGSEKCDAVRELISDMEQLSSNLIFQIFDFDKDKNEAQSCHIDRVPALLVLAGPESKIRFYGIPGGYQMESFLEAIEMVGTDSIDLHPRTVEQAAAISVPVRLQVFVNPKCPYCPAVVITANRLAMASQNISAEMIDIMEFPEVVSQYNVHGVPKVVINDSDYFEGVLPEDLYIEKIMKALTVES
jgi:glutaredoxin-like protein